MPNEAYPKKGLEKDWEDWEWGRKKEGRVFTRQELMIPKAGIYKIP